MAGTRQGLELRANYSWSVEPIYLLKGNGFYAESNVPTPIVFGSELIGEGGVRELITVQDISWNSSELRLEVSLSTNVSAGIDDLQFNRLGLIRGGKAQGAYVGDLDAGAGTITITTPGTLSEPFVAGDKIVTEEFAEYTITGVSGNTLTVSELISSTKSGVNLHDASGTLMVVYVFVQDAIIFANSTTNIQFLGYDIAG